MSQLRLLALHDSNDFGGHEVMFLRLFAGLVGSGAFEQISISFPGTNEKFGQSLARADLPGVELLPSRFVKGRGEPFRAPVRLRYRRHILDLLKTNGPDVVLLLQGRIENLCVPALACKGRVPVVSYVPMAHSVAELRGAGIASTLSDLVRRLYYALPDAFIVPAGSVAAQLVAQGVSQPITIAANTLPALPALSDRAEARQRLGLSPAARVASFMGRLDIHQKGLDLLVDAIARSRPRPAWSFVLVGRGPDEADLRDRVARAGLSDVLTFIPWTERPEDVYAASDILLMPSRYEGVPLVMLEALSNGVPILANDIDVYREYLPAEWITKLATTKSLADDLERAVSYALASTPETRARLLDLDGSSRTFVEALVAAAASARICRGTPPT